MNRALVAPTGQLERMANPALLCDASYYGTLAAARALGKEGVPVFVADSQWVAPASWSCHIAGRLSCPPVADVENFVDWLLWIGKRHSNCVICPTSDELCFVLAAFREDLAQTFSLYQPELSVVEQLLDKGRLLEHARAVGLDVPETWLPESDADVDRAQRECAGPILIKPRTQILLSTHNKGSLIQREGTGLRLAYERFIRGNTYAPAVRERLSAATRPMLQRYYPEATERVYSLAGFRDRTGCHFVAFAANKVLQRPRSMGVGLCFEEAVVDQNLLEGGQELLKRVGYYGVFELEFIRVGGRSLLIDANPRFYNQLAFDVARGLPLPQLAYAGALGQEDVVERLFAGLGGRRPSRTHAFCNQLSLGVMVRAERILGAMSGEEATRWRDWRRDRNGSLVDAVADPEDPGPYVAEVARQVLDVVRSPRLFWRIHRSRPRLATHAE
ncbi:MAG: carbamoyl-phosphate synthase [Polyangiaceae bacterium]